MSPTPIQQQAIPSVMDGIDVIAQAQTGTGKTFAFILPIIEKVDKEASHIQALIVTPTRELALQITDEIQKLIADIEDLNVLAVYGGQDVEKQLKKLEKNVQIVVATPGRLLDHIRRGTVELSHASFLVLDEADQMLHIGFLNEVEEIIRKTPTSRQTMLFSATMSTDVRKLARKHMREPRYIQIEKKQGPAENVDQLAIYLSDRAKQSTIVELIQQERPFLAVLFCRTKRRVSKLYEILKSQGFSVDELHGDLSQAKRERVMKRFREAEIQLLVATDVAARGLDVDGVTHVFNYDIPEDAESYVHRIGRTGRAGMKGLAITFYSPKDRSLFESIEKELNLTIKKQNLMKANDENHDDDFSTGHPSRNSSIKTKDEQQNSFGKKRKSSSNRSPNNKKSTTRGDRKNQSKSVTGRTQDSSAKPKSFKTKNRRSR